MIAAQAAGKRGEETMGRNTAISVDGLWVSFTTPEGIMHPVRNLSLEVCQGEILAILGESGAGKSLLAKTLMGILPSDAQVVKGEISDCFGFEERAMVLQDPKKFLDPTMSIGKQIMETLKCRGVRRSDRRSEAMKLLESVAMDDSEKRFHQYAHELSGGLAQRAVMAVALAKKPKLLIADEPTTALDEKNEEKLIDLLVELSEETALTTILVTHNLQAARKAAHRIAVMYAGRIIEIGTKEEVLTQPVHPYTQALLASDQFRKNDKGRLVTIQGIPPCPMNFPKGDAFSVRNPDALVMDFLEEPPMMKVSDTHYAATWLLDPRCKRSKIAEGGTHG